jgi:hypothetical protein
LSSLGQLLDLSLLGGHIKISFFSCFNFSICFLLLGWMAKLMSLGLWESGFCPNTPETDLQKVAASLT